MGALLALGFLVVVFWELALSVCVLANGPYRRQATAVLIGCVMQFAAPYGMLRVVAILDDGHGTPGLGLEPLVLTCAAIGFSVALATGVLAVRLSWRLAVSLRESPLVRPNA